MTKIISQTAAAQGRSEQHLTPQRKTSPRLPAAARETFEGKTENISYSSEDRGEIKIKEVIRRLRVT